MRQWFHTFFFLFLGGILSLSSYAEEVVKLPSRDGVTQSFLYSAVEQPHASVILFPGGHGRIKVQDDGKMRWGKNNFLVRSREYFTTAGYNIAVFDAPSDYQGSDGMLGGFRYSENHARDTAAVVNYMREQANVPVWLVGTSRGTESVANAAVRRPSLVDGIILTASMSEENNNGFTLPEMELAKITAPVFLATHEDDACWVTPPRGSEFIKTALANAKQVELKTYSGGHEARAGECEGLSAHGFYGIEEKVIKDITTFIQQTR
jgi:pimeloyl-ACP methyl ester carboxylesterase